GRAVAQPARVPGARPPAMRRTAPSGAATRTRAPQPSALSGRAAVLTLILVSLLLAYAYPVRVYLGQQAEIAALEQHQVQQRAQLADLAAQRAKWDDDEYVKTQARRLHYITPGDIPFVVLDDQAPTGPDVGRPRASGSQTGPW